ncbi:MAG: molybdopterin converting factor subunit 1 [Gammaproteobacteria bacterium]|nr:molybdopterin converting factor subunit 1 [Gammaproteobacteria bacterium]
MSITVKFFASIREKIGKAEDIVESDKVSQVSEVWSLCAAQPKPANLLAAVNQEYVTWEHPVRDGDEVAFFPPVTGG